MKPIQRVKRNTSSDTIKDLGLPSETKAHIPKTRSGAEALEHKKDMEQMSAEIDKSNRIGKKRNLDFLTEGLKCTGYYSDIRWPWFSAQIYGVETFMTVNRFYHEKNLAVDTSQVPDLIKAAKEEVLAKHGIKYVVCRTYEEMVLLAKSGGNL